jgi:hypothetical protein
MCANMTNPGHVFNASSISISSIVEGPNKSSWTPERFLLEGNSSGLHVERVKVSSRFFPQHAKNFKTGFVTVTKVPAIYVRRQTS